MGFVLWPGVQAYVSETLYPASVSVLDIPCTPYTPNTVTPLLPIPFSETDGARFEDSNDGCKHLEVGYCARSFF